MVPAPACLGLVRANGVARPAPWIKSVRWLAVTFGL